MIHQNIFKATAAAVPTKDRIIRSSTPISIEFHMTSLLATLQKVSWSFEGVLVVSVWVATWAPTWVLNVMNAEDPVGISDNIPFWMVLISLFSSRYSSLKVLNASTRWSGFQLPTDIMVGRFSLLVIFGGSPASLDATSDSKTIVPCETIEGPFIKSSNGWADVFDSGEVVIEAFSRSFDTSVSESVDFLNDRCLMICFKGSLSLSMLNR